MVGGGSVTVTMVEAVLLLSPRAVAVTVRELAVSQRHTLRRPESLILVPPEAAPSTFHSTVSL